MMPGPCLYVSSKINREEPTEYTKGAEQ